MIKPMLFNSEMVRAILEGRKSVTRRVVKPQPIAAVKTLYRKDETNFWRTHGADCWYEFRAPCAPGDILWVRETWAKSMAGTFMYRADDKAIMVERWHPSIHMPREAARIFLRVTGVRVERLQEITPQQAMAEGQPRCTGSITICGGSTSCQSCEGSFGNARQWFSEVWDSTIDPKDRAAYGWNANPWVWVIELQRISKEEADHEK